SAPYEKGEMAKYAPTMSLFYTLSTPKCTGIGFTKWTSRQASCIYPHAGGTRPEQQHGVHGHRRSCGLPEHRDHLWEPDLLGIAGSHHHPLPCLGILYDFPRCDGGRTACTVAQREDAVVLGLASCQTLHEASIRPCHQ